MFFVSPWALMARTGSIGSQGMVVAHFLPPALIRLSKCASVTNPIGTGFFAIPMCDKHPLVDTLRKVRFE